MVAPTHSLTICSEVPTVKYRGNFDVDACERQFERQRGREARVRGEGKFEKFEKETLKRALGGATRKAGRARERVRKPRPWQERD